MFVWNACLLIAAAFVTEVPEPIRAKLSSTNETSGAFVQIKTAADGRSYVTKGTYRIRPGVDFTWRTLEPFETCFTATTTDCVYSNEDETVTRKLSDGTMTIAKKSDASQTITIKGWNKATHNIVYADTLTAFTKYLKAASPTTAQTTSARNEVWKKAGLAKA